VVANGDLEALADAVAEASRRDRDRDRAVRSILAHHTWDQRARAYDDVIARHARA
jgi:hypothetical protein